MHAKNSTTARQHYIVREGKKRQATMDASEGHIRNVREKLDRTDSKWTQ